MHVALQAEKRLSKPVIYPITYVLGGQGFSADVLYELRIGAATSATQYIEAMHQREHARQVIDGCLAAVDALILVCICICFYPDTSFYHIMMRFFKLLYIYIYMHVMMPHGTMLVSTPSTFFSQQPEQSLHYVDKVSLKLKVV